MLTNKSVILQLDMLEIFIDEFRGPKESLRFIYGLSDNSKTGVYKYFDDIEKVELEFYCVLTTVPGYGKHFRFDFEYEDIKLKDCFSISIGRQQGAITSKTKLTFTGSFITYFGIEFLERFIDTTFDRKFLYEVKRFDIAIDIPESKKNIIKSLLKKPTSNINYNAEKKEYETVYIGNRKSDTSFVRIYDKILDSIKKSKTDLYNFNSEVMTRIEIEYRREFIEGLNKDHYGKIYWRNLLTDNKLLKDLFFHRISQDMTFFSSIDFKRYDFTFLKPKRTNLEKYYLETNQLPTWWKKNALGMFIKLKNIIGIEKLFLYLKLTDKEIETILKYYIKIKRTFLVKKYQKKKLNTNTSFSDLINSQIDFSTEITELLLQDNLAEATEIKLVLETALQKNNLIFKK